MLHDFTYQVFTVFMLIQRKLSLILKLHYVASQEYMMIVFNSP
jgi:hypothetical protein